MGVLTLPASGVEAEGTAADSPDRCGPDWQPESRRVMAEINKPLESISDVVMCMMK
jgi:hypothetical protein